MDIKIKEEIVFLIRERLDLSRELTDTEIKDLIDEVILSKSRTEYFSIKEKAELAQEIFNSLRRLDAIQPLIEDDSVTEIMVNGSENIFVERAGEIIETDIRFLEVTKLEDVIQNIVSKMNRVANEASPICDARLENGSRINVVLPPIAINGPILTIRKFSKEMVYMEQLIEWEAITSQAANFLKGMIAAKYNIFISGGTGSGKTTLLNILTNYIPKKERIITIEDSAELNIKSVKNLVRLETRNPNIEGKGEIGIAALIRTALRMRPDRIVVGEVRGGEALDMLQAMNTGHDGSLSTGHANSVKDMIARLETMVLSRANFPLEAIRQQIASSIDIMIHLGRMRDNSRKVLEISEISGYADNEIVINPLYIFREKMQIKGEKVIGKLEKTDNKMKNVDKFIAAGLEREDGLL